MSHGLGLAICKQMAKGLGGDLKYLKPSKGASFMLSLNLEIVNRECQMRRRSRRLEEAELPPESN